MTRSPSPIAQALHQSDRTYRTLIERMNEGVVIVDADGQIQFVNQRYCEMLGYDRSELIGRHETEMVMPDQSAALDEKTALRQQGIHDQYELCLRQKSGAPLWCLIHGSPYDDDDIGIHGTMGMVVDITQRKQAEQALQRSQYKQRVLLEAIPDLILELDKDGTYLDFFAGKEFPFMGSYLNPVGKTIFDQLPPNMARDRMNAVQQALQTEQVQVYEYETTVDNHTYYEEARVSKSGENEVLVIVRDISDRKRFELELQTLTHLQQAILDGADYTIVSTDANGIIQTFNATAEQLLGYRAEDVIGNETPLLFHDAEEIERQAAILSEQFGQSIAPGFDVFRWATDPDTVHDQEWTYVTRTGDRIPVLLSVTALQNANGEVVGYLGIGRDISVRRQIDAERRQLASVVENSSELVGIVSTDGTFEFLNHAGQALLNLPADAIASTRLIDMLHPNDRPTFTHTVMPMLDANSIWNGELILQSGDRTISVLMNAFRLQAQPCHESPKIAIVAQDVTELKQASEALAIAQTQFRRLFANVPGMLFQLTQHADGQQSFPFMGYQCSRLLGISREMLQTNPAQFWEMMHPDDRTRVIQAFTASQQSQLPMQREWRMILPSGEVKWVQGIARPEHQTDGTVLWDGIIIDISDRKRLEEERNQFFNLSPDLMAITDFNGRFSSVNPAVTSMLGYRPESFQGNVYLSYIHPDDYSETQHTLKQIADGDCRYIELDNRYRHQDGSYRWLSWRAVAVPEKQLIYAIAHDVTEEKQVEQELRQSRDELELRVQERTVELNDAYQRLSFLVENSPMGVIEWNSEFQVQGWSPKACEIFGWTLGEVVNRHPSEWGIVYQDDQPLVNEAMQELVDGIKTQNVCQNRNLTKSGEVIYCEWYNSALFDDNGCLVSMLSLVLDVTERKRAEQELKASQERFAIAFNASPIALSITSFPDSTHLLVNNAWVSSTGYTREEAIGQTSRELGLWEYIDERERFIHQLETNGHVHNMLIHSRDKWGVLQTILLSSDRIDLGGQMCLLSACFNISDRVRAEKALQESKEFSENLIANLQDGFSLLDANGVHLDVNQAFCDMSGYSRAELIGVAPPHPYWPEDDRTVIQQIIQQLATQDDVDDIELTFQRKNGQRFPVIVTPAVLRDAQGNVTNYMALIKDISHIKTVQEELRRSRDELEVRVIQRTTELADVNAYLQTQIIEREKLTEQLLHSNQELEQFAYIASHDLQEPLRAITSYTQLLSRRYEGQIDEKADKYIHYIVDGASYMQQLIQDLLTYSRVGRGELNLEPVDLNRMLHQVEKNLDVAIAESNTTLTYDSLPTITADLHQLTRLLQNLMSNSIKYRGDRTPVIQVTVEDHPNEWQFSIQDNGIGFDPQYAERVFVVFQRLHTRRKYPGTGIGLAICKKIVDRHHGHIWVDSVPDEGATFYFTIPKNALTLIQPNNATPSLNASDASETRQPSEDRAADPTDHPQEPG